VPLSPEQGIGSLEMLMEHYEAARPDADQAPRHGDARVLADGGLTGGAQTMRPRSSRSLAGPI
jgi:hydrogenase maturation protease